MSLFRYFRRNKPPSSSSSPTPLGKCPIDQSSLPSILTMWWLNHLLIVGYQRVLDMEEVVNWGFGAEEDSHRVTYHFDQKWKYYVEKKVRYPLLRAMLSSYGKRWMIGGIGQLFARLLVLPSPVFIGLILSDIQSHSSITVASLMYLLGLVVTTAASSILNNHFFYQGIRIGTSMRAALMSAIYAKALRVSSAVRQSYTTGQMVNMMSTDSQHFYQAASLFHFIWVDPILVICTVVLLYREIGVASLVAAALMALLLPMQIVVAKHIGTNRGHQVKYTDHRVKLMSEILQGIRIIKFYAWEVPLANSIRSVRVDELAHIRTSIMWKSFNLLLLFVWPVLVSMATFTVYVLLGKTFSIQSSITALAFINVLQRPITVVPMALSDCSELRVSLGRITRFLMAEELQDEDPTSLLPKQKHVMTHQIEIESKMDGEMAVVVNDASFKWDRMSSICHLQHINLSIPKGKLVGIIGHVGSGKSSLLSALLGEMYRYEGTCTLYGRIAYTSQQPWIRNETVRDNILFGLPYDEQQYQRVIEAAALKPDLSVLQDGDQTEIGERGITLSGGQKARVSLARAVYRQAISDLYLLDDPFSAVDASTGSHMFHHCIQRELANKTRLLVLNSHLHFLRDCDLIIVMQSVDGQAEIAAIGPYDVVSRTYGALMSVDEEEHKQQDTSINDTTSSTTITTAPSQSQFNTDSDNDDDDSGIIKFHMETDSSIDMIHDDKSPTSIAHTSSTFDKSLLTITTTTAPAQLNKTHTSLMVAEERVSGAIQWQTYKYWFTSATAAPRPPYTSENMDDVLDTVSTSPPSHSHSHPITVSVSGVDESPATRYSKLTFGASSIQGILLFAFMLSIFVITQCVRVGCDIWLALWGKDSTHTQPHTNEFWIFGSIIWWVALCIILGIRSVLFANVARRASSALHDHLFSRLLRAPTSWFDTQPMGRIMNRFSKDLDQVDAYLPDFLSQFLHHAFNLFSGIILACVAVPWFAILVIPLGWMFSKLQSYFRVTSRELKRLEGISRSPIFSSFSETLLGLSTIRSYGLTHSFMEQHINRVNRNAIVFFNFLLSGRWLSLRLDALSVLIVLAVGLFAVLLRGTLDPAVIGLALTYSMQLTGFLQWAVRISVETENSMTAVERLSHYGGIENEAAYVKRDKRPSSEWPSHGAISIKQLRLRYRPDLPDVLCGIDVEIKPCEKVGICGRTGSGKSSLMQALFRMVEARDGSISIDGINIGEIGLCDLRSRMSIIPQDPVLFSGTVRYNLDPFSIHTDAALQSALEQVHMWSSISLLPDGLNAMVSEGGDNFSCGQRQLMCIARALLRKTRIIVLDEATAAVDHETDALIQQTIRKTFAECTVLTIAHRLNTIADADRILVLDAGRVAQFDTPKNLLQDKNGIFANMAGDSLDSLIDGLH